MKKWRSVLCMLLALSMMMGIFPVVHATGDNESETANISTTDIAAVHTKAEVTTAEDITVNSVVEAAEKTILGGSCGENVYWKLDDEGVFTIYGEGPMKEYGFDWDSYEPSVPWVTERSSIKKVIIEDGVTSVSAYSFYECWNMTEIVIGDDVEVLGEESFSGNTKVVKLTVGKSLKIIQPGGRGVFNGVSLQEIHISDMAAWCTISGERPYAQKMYLNGQLITEVEIPDTIDRIVGSAFASYGITSVVVPDTITSIDGFAFGSSTICSVSYNGNLSQWLAIERSGDIFAATDGRHVDLYIDGELLKDAIIPEGITEIGDYAFASTAIQTVEIPDSVVRVGQAVFKNCTNLMAVSCGNNLQIIGRDVFDNCKKLSQVTLSENLEKIGVNAFLGCVSLTTLALPQQLDDIPENMLKGCSNLQTLVIPSSVSTIGANAFEDCINLQALVIPSSVSTIGTSAFEACTALESIEILGDLVEIPQRCFAECINLRNVILSDTVESIGNSAFEMCSSLERIQIPVHVKELNDNAFRDCTALSEVIFQGNAPTIANTAFNRVTATCIYPKGNTTYTKEITTAEFGGELTWLYEGEIITNKCGDNLIWSLSEDGVLTISGSGDMYDYSAETLTYAPWYDNRNTVTSIVMEGEITSIGDYAFYLCQNAATITIPESITSIGNYAFYKVPLKNFGFPNGLKSIGDYAFRNTKLSKVVLPSSLQNLGIYAFMENYELQNVTLPDDMEHIPEGAFKWCPVLMNITIPSKLKTIGAYAFAGCYGLGKLVLPEGLVSIGDSAFQDCGGYTIYYYNGGFTSITLPSTLETIGAKAFYGCINLKSITLPANLKTIGAQAFQACEKLTQITIPEGVTTLPEDIFTLCKSLESVTLPNSIKSVEMDAFLNCDSLKQVRFGWNAPVFADTLFTIGVTAKCYYPSNNPDWTEEILLKYGGSITWVGEEMEEPSLGGADDDDSDLEVDDGTGTDDTKPGDENENDGGNTPGGGGSGEDPGNGDDEGKCADGHTFGELDRSIEPTCTEQGYTTYKCSVCGYSYVDNYVAALGHIGGIATCKDKAICDRCEKAYGELNAANHTGETEIRNAAEAICTEAGYTGDTHCTGCGAKLSSGAIIEAKGHSMGDWTETKPSTCAEKGSERRDCDNCDYFETQEIKVKDHDYRTVISAPTCAEQGYTTHKCSVCGHSYIDSYVVALGHIGGTATCKDKAICDRCEKAYGEPNAANHTGETEIRNAAEATCTEAGYTGDTHCTDCGAKLSSGAIIEAKGHSFGDWTETKPSTCVEKGSERRDCDNCDYFETQEIEVKDHDYRTVISAPTCTEQGYTTHKCSVCEHSYIDSYVAALGHIGGIATCKDKAICDRCETAYGELNAANHTGETEIRDAAEATCTETGYTGDMHCKDCGAKLSSGVIIVAKGHSMGDWTETKPSTCVEKGSERRDCDNCDYFETQEIAEKDHDYDVIFIEPTCTEYGKEIRTCIVCDYWEEIIVPAYGCRMEVIVEAIEATCNKSGHTAGTQCIVCGKVMLSVAIPPTGEHSFVNNICEYCGLNGGSCGENLTWILDADGTLTISGTGDMYDYTGTDIPWNDHSGTMQSVMVENGVTSIGDFAFYYCTSLSDITLPLSVNSIGDFAFCDCNSLTDVAIPENVTNIGESAFVDCDSLQSIKIPEGVTSISDSMLKQCWNLTDVVLPSELISIGNEAFSYCRNLKNIEIPSGVISIGEHAFSNTKLESIVLPEGITKIGEYTFSSCSELISISIPESVSEIGHAAFSGCDSLINLILPENLNSIGYSAFSDCSNLTSIILPENVTSIDGFAFSECSSLTNIRIPDKVVSIGLYAFSDCINLTSVIFDGNAPELAEKVFRNVVATAYYPGNNATWTEDVRQDYGGSITWVAQETEDANVISGTCGENLTWTLDEEGTLTISGTGDMDNYTFGGTSPWYKHAEKIQSIVVNPGATSVGDYAFMLGGSPTSVTLPSGITSIGNGAFYSLYNLPSITLPEGLTTIGRSAFAMCASLESVYFPDSLISIGVGAFSECIVLSDVVLPYSLISIGDLAFDACYGLTSISIPANISSIANRAFACCENLNQITVSGDNPYYSNDNQGALYNKDKTQLLVVPKTAKNFVIPASVVGIGEYAFSYCRSITDITIPKSVRSIGEGAFQSCSTLSSVVIPDGVTSVGKQAFRDSAVRSVYFPASITSIGEGLFLYCLYLSELTFEGDAPEIADNSFETLTATAYYPGNNSTWTEDVRQDYGGSITWVAQETEDANVISGTCGENLNWTLDEEGTLTISGTGDMDDYFEDIYSIPWKDYYDQIINVVLEDGVTSIGTYAFYRCTNLANISIPDSVTTMPISIYTNNLEKLVIPAGVVDLQLAFEENFVKFIEVVPENKVYSSDEFGVLFNKDKTVLECYPGGSAMTEYSVPESVTMIGPAAFRGCRIIENVTLPENLVELGKLSFCYSGINEIHFKGNAPQFGYGVFADLNADVYYPAGNPTWILDVMQDYRGTINWIAENTEEENAINGTCGENLTWTLDEDGTLTISGTGDMYNYAGNNIPWNTYKGTIQAVMVENGVTSIGDYAFYQCRNLTSIEIPNTVTSIGKSAFWDCLALENVSLPNSLENIGNGAFSGCISLPKIEIPNGVISIGSIAFHCCPSLTRVTIPESVTTIGSNAFGYCESLTGIDVAISNPYYCNDNQGALYNKEKTQLFAIPGAMENFVVPDGVTSIDYDSIGNCPNLTGITLPKSLMEIGRATFAFCSNLNSVVFNGDVPEIAENAFESLTTTAYYPVGNATWTNDVLQDYGGDLTWLAKYEVLEGDDIILDPIVLPMLVIKTDSEITKFQSVTVDGEIVDPVNYTVTEGSTIVTFTAEYLKTLSEGEHTVMTHFTDGISIAKVTIEKTEYLLGDVTGDGKVTATDYSRLLAHVKKVNLITDEAALAAADVTGDGKITATDYSRLLAHVKKVAPLW